MDNIDQIRYKPISKNDDMDKEEEAIDEDQIVAEDDCMSTPSRLYPDLNSIKSQVSPPPRYDELLNPKFIFYPKN